MGGMLAGGRRRPDRRWAPLVATTAVFCLALALAAGPAVSKKITGSKRGEKIVGTKGADRINGKAGNDLIKGKRGNDRLNGAKGSDKVVGGKGKDAVIGGKGPDTVIGGKGVDRHLGGPGNDLLNAVDGRRDAVIDAGPGGDRCIVDIVELSIVRNCGQVQGSRPGGGQGPGGGGPGGGPGPGPGEGLRVNNVTLQCGGPIGCLFIIEGDGADAPVGTVEGGGGVTAFGVAVAITGPEWTATGGCSGTGFLRVTIGEESIDVPVTCGG